MDIREFSYILAIVKNGSFTKAANELYISQSSLSLYVKNLENRLGFKFFAKVNRSLVLTDEGQVYVKYAKKIMELNNSMCVELDQLASRRKAYCRVGLTVSRSMDIMPSFMRLMQERYPGICAEVTVSKTNDLVNGVINQELDFILINKSFENKNLEYTTLHKDTLVVAINKKDPLLRFAENRPDSRLRYIDMKHLVGSPVVTFQKGNWQRKMMEYLFEMQGATPRIICETNNHLSAVAHVEAGLGFATMVKSGIARAADYGNVEFLLLDNPYPPIEFVIARLKDNDMSNTVKNAIEVIREITEELYSDVIDEEKLAEEDK